MECLYLSLFGLLLAFHRLSWTYLPSRHSFLTSLLSPIIHSFICGSCQSACSGLAINPVILTEEHYHMISMWLRMEGQTDGQMDKRVDTKTPNNCSNPPPMICSKGYICNYADMLICKRTMQSWLSCTCTYSTCTCIPTGAYFLKLCNVHTFCIYSCVQKSITFSYLWLQWLVMTTFYSWTCKSQGRKLQSARILLHMQPRDTISMFLWTMSLGQQTLLFYEEDKRFFSLLCAN